MTTFNLEIITPDGFFFKGETENIIVRTTVGDKGILARHENYTAALATGKIRVLQDGEYRVAALSSGIIKVAGDKTLILAQSCEWGDEINIERAEKARHVAEERLHDPLLSHNEHDVAEFKLRRALNRLDAAGKGN